MKYNRNVRRVHIKHAYILTPEAAAASAAYYVERPWMVKPPRGTRINKSHPHARGLLFYDPLWGPNSPVGSDVPSRDLVGQYEGAKVEVGGTTAVGEHVATSQGYCWEQNITTEGSNEEYGFTYGDILKNLEGSGQMTMAARVYLGNTSHSGGSRIISKRDTGGGSDIYALYIHSSGAFRGRINGNNITVADIPDQGRWLDCMCSYNAGSADARYAYLDEGVVYDQNDTGLGTTVDASTANLTVGHRDDEDRDFDGIMAFVAIWDREWSEKEWVAFSQNPWQIFEPEKIWIEGAAEEAAGPTLVIDRPWQSQPPTYTPLDTSHGYKPVWAMVPGWFPIDGGGVGAAGDDENGVAYSVGHVQRFEDDIINAGGNTTTIKSQPVQAGWLGSVMATTADQHLQNASAHRLFIGSSEDGYGIPFRSDNLTLLAIVIPTGDGRPGGFGDPRIFSKDTGTQASDHDLMIGIANSGNAARTRIRINGDTKTVLTAGTPEIQDDALNLIAGTVERTAASTWEVDVKLLREDGQSNTGDSPLTDTAGYTPRNTTHAALFATAAASDNAFEGTIIGVWAFDRILTEAELWDFFYNPWQIFKPQRIIL